MLRNFAPFMFALRKSPRSTMAFWKLAPVQEEVYEHHATRDLGCILTDNIKHLQNLPQPHTPAAHSA